MSGDFKRRRVAVTGLGVIAPNGIGVEAFWSATREGRSGIVSIDRFDAADFSSQIAGLVKDFDPLDHIPSKTVKMTDRSTHFALAASKMAVEDAGLDLDSENRDRIGVSIGTGLGGVMFYEEQILAAIQTDARKANPLCVPRITANAPASYVAAQYGIRGPNLTSCTACSSGGHGVGQGFRMVRTGDADVAVCGGTEACLLFYTFRAFDAMRVMSKRNDQPAKASRPFDKDRDGFVMGEGCGILVLEELQHARSRGARIYAEVVGYGASGGAHHIVMPVSDGSDAVLAMQRALDDAGLEPSQVDYINAHGTSTQANDKSETLAIKTLLGERAREVPISSTKSMIGHTIGAAGAIEAVVCVLAIRDQFVPPTINYKTSDPDCDLDYVPNQGRAHEVKVALSNSFGFGNNNAVLALAKETKE